ncbi:MAG: hypothetical protein SVM80_11570 [Halobacteriota archaeon]|nr:hypothetical protein [Halobacteriota archaeon]
MTEQKIGVADFPPFIRFELEPALREELFTKALDRVGSVEIERSAEEFWRSLEDELKISRYEMIFGKGKGGVIRSLMSGPKKAKEIVEDNPELSKFLVYHSIGDLKNEGMVKNKRKNLVLIEDYFSNVRISDQAYASHMKNKGEMKKLKASKIELGLALYLWPAYKKASVEDKLDIGSKPYGKSYEDEFSLAIAINDWRKGKRGIPQWALISISSLASINLDASKGILSYHMPPGKRITPRYKRGYKLPIVVTSTLDEVALMLLIKGTSTGQMYNLKYKDELFEKLYSSFGFFSSNNIPSAIIEIIKRHYKIDSFDKDSIAIPPLIKEKLESLPEYEKDLYKAFLLETILKFSSKYASVYELTSRSKVFLEEVSQMVKELGIGEISIKKKKNRPHYRSIFKQSHINRLNQSKDLTDMCVLEDNLDFLTETEMERFLDYLREEIDEDAPRVICNLSSNSGFDDEEISNKSVLPIKHTRAIIYKLIDESIVYWRIRKDPETGIHEYKYLLNESGIMRVIQESDPVEEFVYPFPENFVTARV